MYNLGLYSRLKGFIIRKGPRTPEPSLQMGGKEPIIREPEYPISPAELTQLGKTHWLLRMIIRAIQQESIGPGWKIKSRFITRCDDCKENYKEKIDICPKCNGQTRFPNQEEKQKLEKIINQPNPEYSFYEMLKSIVFWDHIVGDYYVSIAYSTVPVNGEKKKIPMEIYLEDPRTIRPIADEYGHLGNFEYFCQFCYNADEDNYTMINKGDPIPKCPRCGEEMKQTAYVQQIMGKIAGRFSIDEMVHGSSTRIAPELFGCSKVIALWKQLMTVDNMDMYNYEVYKKGKTASILCMPGFPRPIDSQAFDQEMKRKHEEKIRDPASGRIQDKKSLDVAVLTVPEKPELVQVMPDLTAMQSLEFWKIYREAVGSVWGVTPVFVNVIESGKSGNNPTMQIDVMNRCTREDQHNKEYTFNELVWPKLGIYDWIFEFNDIEQEDKLLSANIALTKARALEYYRKAGYDVELDEEYNIMAIKPMKYQHTRPNYSYESGDEDDQEDEEVASELPIVEEYLKEYPVWKNDLLIIFENVLDRLKEDYTRAQVRRFARDEFKKILQKMSNYNDYSEETQKKHKDKFSTTITKLLDSLEG